MGSIQGCTQRSPDTYLGLSKVCGSLRIRILYDQDKGYFILYKAIIGRKDVHGDMSNKKKWGQPTWCNFIFSLYSCLPNKDWWKHIVWHNLCSNVVQMKYKTYHIKSLLIENLEQAGLCCRISLKRQWEYQHHDLIWYSYYNINTASCKAREGSCNHAQKEAPWFVLRQRRV